MLEVIEEMIILSMTNEELIQHLEIMIPSRMEQEKVTGFSAVLIDKANVIWSKGFGYSHASLKKPMTKNTNTEAGSLSKPVFAYLVLKACEKGLLDLDIPLVNYLSHPKIENMPLFDLITARMVLSHSTGLPNWKDLPPGRELKVYLTPGSRFTYSGEGYQYLQAVPEHFLVIQCL